MNPTHCPKCGAPFERWALIDSTLVPYEPHANGNLLLEQTPHGPARLVRPPARFTSQRHNDPSKFRARQAGDRFVSHYAVCPKPFAKPQEHNHV